MDRVVPEDPDDLDPDTLAHSEGRTRSPSKSESSWDYSDSLLDHSKRGLELARMGKYVRKLPTPLVPLFLVKHNLIWSLLILRLD